MEKEIFRAQHSEFRDVAKPETGVSSPTEHPHEIPIEPQLSSIRAELSNFIGPVLPDNVDLVSETLIGPIPDTGNVIMNDKLTKRRQKELKESSPKQYTEMLVVFNDTQLLRETDQEALGAFLKYVEANKDRITHLVANGDILDFSAQSFFEKDLETMNSANDEIEAGQWLIQHLSNLLPNAEKVFIEGNHEARWSNMISTEKGNEAWIKTLDEQFGLSENGWKHIKYGSGQIYEWHDRIFWHGHRSGAKSNVPKLEMEDAGTSVSTAHINRNMFHENTDARGVRKSGITHGGFSKDNLGFMKKAATGWSQGFGVYFHDGKKTETPYMITMSHRNPRFIGPDGNIYDGTGFEIPGFEKPKRGRGRPRKT